MSYPVDDASGVLGGVNLLLSGPSGLGQHFTCFYASCGHIDNGAGGQVVAGEAYLNGNFNQPFTQATPAPLYVAPIALNNAEHPDAYTWKYFFATPQATPPFLIGNQILVSGVVAEAPWESYYNGYFLQTGVTECTTEYVIAQLTTPYPDNIVYVSGGEVSYSVMYLGPDSISAAGNRELGTDCNGKITVTNGTDAVIVSGQLTNTISYTATTASDLQYKLFITRYDAYQTGTIQAPSYGFSNPQIINQRIISGGALSGLNGTGSIALDGVLASFIDPNLTLGYYWYFLSVQFSVTNAGDLQVTQSQLGLRSLTLQSLKL